MSSLDKLWKIGICYSLQGILNTFWLQNSKMFKLGIPQHNTSHCTSIQLFCRFHCFDLEFLHSISYIQNQMALNTLCMFDGTIHNIRLNHNSHQDIFLCTFL